MILTQSTFESIEEARILILGWLRSVFGLDLAPDDGFAGKLARRRSR